MLLRLIPLHVNTTVLEAKSDESALDASVLVTSLFPFQIQFSTLMVKDLFLFDDLTLEELGKEEAQDPKSDLEAVDDQEIEVLIGKTRISVLVEAVRVLFQGGKDNQGFQVEQEVHHRSHLVLYESRINGMGVDYSFQVLLVLVFGSVEADDGSEETEEAADIVCVAHPGVLIRLNPGC